MIRKLRDQGISVLITDHAAREILQVTDRCYVINEGTVLCHGPPEEVKRHPEVRRIYLGDIDGTDELPSGSHEHSSGSHEQPPAPHAESLAPRRRDDLSVSPRRFLQTRRRSSRRRADT
jgi:lipopolysaccharide export system ATP-binding protein